MDGLKISLEDGTVVPVTREIPEELQDYALARSENWYAQVGNGSMLFSQFKGDGYSIWKSRYDFPTPVKIRGEYAGSVLELGSMYQQSFSIDWKKVVKQKLVLKQMDMYYATHIDNTAEFKGGPPAFTLDVHFDAAVLDNYAAEFPVLGKFMDSVHAGKPATLFDGSQCSSPRMDYLLQNIMEVDMHDGLAPIFYDSHVNLLLVQLLDRVGKYTPGRKLSASHRDKAHDAHALIMRDHSKHFTIRQLARQLHTSPFVLKTAFKHQFNVSIGQYYRNVRMNYALQLLQETELTMEDIALALEYGSHASFCTAFHKHFGYTPGSVRRRG